MAGFRDLHPMSVFLVDADAWEAARALADVHVCSQARALQIETYQIALRTGADLTGFPRAAGHYPQRPLSLAGSWAVATSANWLWWSNYTLAVLTEYTHRYERRHLAEDRVWWLFDRMGAPAAPGKLWPPPVPGEACADLDEVVRTSRILYDEENREATYTTRTPPAWMVRGSGARVIIDYEAEDLPSEGKGPAVTYNRARLLGAA